MHSRYRVHTSSKLCCNGGSHARRWCGNIHICHRNAARLQLLRCLKTTCFCASFLQWKLTKRSRNAMIGMLVRALGKPLVLPYTAASASWRRFLSTGIILPYGVVKRNRDICRLFLIISSYIFCAKKNHSSIGRWGLLPAARYLIRKSSHCSLPLLFVLSRMLFTRCTHNIWSCALSCSVTSSRAAICFTSSRNMASACSFRSAR